MRQILWIVVGLGLLGFIGILLYYHNASFYCRRQVSSAKEVGEALIGGSFELQDSQGKTWTDQDFKGKYLLIYFGYSYCPDICPMGLHNLSEALDILPKEDQGLIQPLFITVDPERDTQAHLKVYMENFHPKILALTGHADAVKQVMKAYKVYAARVNGDERGATDYLMDHSSIVYLMDPQGKYVAHFTHKTPPQEMAQGIQKVLR
jgi:protein SCO1/2